MDSHKLRHLLAHSKRSLKINNKLTNICQRNMLCRQMFVNLLYILLEHFVMLSLNLAGSQAKSFYLYKNLRAKVQRCCFTSIANV